MTSAAVLHFLAVYLALPCWPHLLSFVLTLVDMLPAFESYCAEMVLILPTEPQLFFPNKLNDGSAPKGCKYLL